MKSIFPGRTFLVDPGQTLHFQRYIVERFRPVVKAAWGVGFGAPRTKSYRGFGYQAANGLCRQIWGWLGELLVLNHK